MRSTIILSSLASLAAAAPAAAPSPAPSSSSCASQTAQPGGYGPKSTNPDTAEAFLANQVYSNAASSAVTPPGYAQSFVNLQAATTTSNYLTYYDLQSYDPSVCKAKCDAVTGCTAFNLYFERDPSVLPDASACPNPSSFTNVKCSLWGTALTSATATNSGQYRASFHVVIAGSNGYNKLPPAQPGFDGPTPLTGAIIAPDGSTYIGVRFQAGSTLNTTFCASECAATTANDRSTPKADGTYMPCNFFNAWVGVLGGVVDGTHCAEYTQPWGKPYDTNYGQMRGNQVYSVTQSYGYSLNPQDSGKVSATNA
ncbi:hypothetical protein HO173_007523 [Letharia columbiana]|uniref:Uncharacterized protein n=1 Tax=Letharia columbiana TaxID=112416 RepID=A0A8H6FSY0_9LECA|nr:uncharacterized protein HO173_007523 [Letharia columbiana]KAF6234104.1 hypothetical protein HO173_007523 [Letharia columbiana]